MSQNRPAAAVRPQLSRQKAYSSTNSGLLRHLLACFVGVALADWLCRLALKALGRA